MSNEDRRKRIKAILDEADRNDAPIVARASRAWAEADFERRRAAVEARVAELTKNGRPKPEPHDFKIGDVVYVGDFGPCEILRHEGDDLMLDTGKVYDVFACRKVGDLDEFRAYTLDMRRAAT